MLPVCYTLFQGRSSAQLILISRNLAFCSVDTGYTSNWQKQFAALVITNSSCLFTQGFVKSRLEEAAVSQRDLQRVFNMLAFFIQHHNQRRLELPLTVPTAHEAVVHRSLLLSIALVYYFRLSSQLRQDFLGALDAMGRPQQDDQVPCYDMAEVVKYELDLYIDAAELPPGIAANQALRENFYCVAVCMQTKTPLIIVGTPGKPPTLAKLSSRCPCVPTAVCLSAYPANIYSTATLYSLRAARCPNSLKSCQDAWQQVLMCHINKVFVLC